MKSLFLVLIMLFSFTCNAATLKKNSHVCITENYYDQLMEAATKDDNHAIRYLMKSNKCLFIEKKLPCTVLFSKGWIRQIRLYVGGSTYTVWVPENNVSE